MRILLTILSFVDFVNCLPNCRSEIADIELRSKLFFAFLDSLDQFMVDLSHIFNIFFVFPCPLDDVASQIRKSNFRVKPSELYLHKGT